MHKIEFTSIEKTILLDGLMSEYYGHRDDSEMIYLCPIIEALYEKVQKS